MKVQYRASFLKDLRNIKNKNVLNRVKEIIELVEKADTVWAIPNLKKLKSGHSYYCIRLGEYRIGITINGPGVTVVRCLHRKEIYRFFP